MPKGLNYGQPKKAAAELIQFLEANGFEFEHSNTKGVRFYVHPSIGSQSVSPFMNENAARHLHRKVARVLGLPTDLDKSKRDAGKVKDRQAKARAQAAAEFERAEKERDRLVAEREDLIGRFGAKSFAETNAIIAQIEKAEREMRYWQAQMTETPNSGHAGVKHAAHRA